MIEPTDYYYGDQIVHCEWCGDMPARGHGERLRAGECWPARLPILLTDAEDGRKATALRWRGAR